MNRAREFERKGEVKESFRTLLVPPAIGLAKPSEPDKVDAYMQGLKHPLADVVEALRRIILSTDREIGEEVRLFGVPRHLFQAK